MCILIRLSPPSSLPCKKLSRSLPPVSSADPDQTVAADTQFHNWTTSITPTPTVQPALNGIQFLPDYKYWRTVSTTDRGDNHTMRAILGNDIAIHAIETKQVQPWPDGAAFAKIAWERLSDNQGAVHPGRFIQVEFMIKDKTKDASTAGWGWARWRGTDLKPYGKNAEFTGECVSRHLPAGDNHYVYTIRHWPRKTRKSPLITSQPSLLRSCLDAPTVSQLVRPFQHVSGNRSWQAPV